MATKVHMEALSPTMEEGQLVKWLKNEGDEIKAGDILAEIETDKATMELVARGSGVLRKRMLNEGQTAKVGDVIGVIAAPDEDISGIAGGAAAAPTEEKPIPAAARKQETVENAAAPETEKPRLEQRAKPRTEEEEARTAELRRPVPPPAETREVRAEGERVKASPIARRMAAESGVDLAGIQGSGPGGRIIRKDIEAAGEAAPAAAPAYRPAFAAGPESEDVPVTQMRKTIAKRLVTSIGPVPTFYLTTEVDMSRMVEARERVNQQLKDAGVKASVNDFIIKAVAAALARQPEVNAAWHENVIRRYHRVHIGVAVAVEDGLITPVVRDANVKGVVEISTEVRELAGRAREKKLKPEEYTGATFSISNLGMFGIDEFTAIINPPEAAILAVGRVEDKVVAENGAVVIRPQMRITMSCDHRVIDGATGAKFLQTLRAYLEEPVMMLV